MWHITNKFESEAVHLGILPLNFYNLVFSFCATSVPRTGVTVVPGSGARAPETDSYSRDDTFFGGAFTLQSIKYSGATRVCHTGARLTPGVAPVEFTCLVSFISIFP